MVKVKVWRLDEWNGRYAKEELRTIPMNEDEIKEAIKYLRDNNYPKPEDCLEQDCPVYRPACKLDVCRIAVGMCGDF